jgi:hypothetical protein
VISLSLLPLSYLKKKSKEQKQKTVKSFSLSCKNTQQNKNKNTQQNKQPTTLRYRGTPYTPTTYSQ